MSDLAATTCGGGCSNSDNGCSWIIILLLLCSCCGGNSTGFFGGGGCGDNGCNSIIWIILILCCFIWSTAFDSTCFSFLFQTVHTILVNLIDRIFFDHKLSGITSVFLLSDPVICFKLFCFSIMIVTHLLLPSDNPLFFWVSCFRIYYQYMSASKKRNA